MMEFAPVLLHMNAITRRHQRISVDKPTAQETRMPYFVLADEPLPDELAAMLAADCDVHVWPNDEVALAPLLERADAFFTYGHMPTDGALMDRMPRLKIISNFGVG